MKWDSGVQLTRVLLVTGMGGPVELSRERPRHRA
jgi:hypothetical protein